jgi:hypothetical protein
VQEDKKNKVLTELDGVFTLQTPVKTFLQGLCPHKTTFYRMSSAKEEGQLFSHLPDFAYKNTSPKFKCNCERTQIVDPSILLNLPS